MPPSLSVQRFQSDSAKRITQSKLSKAERHKIQRIARYRDIQAHDALQSPPYEACAAGIAEPCRHIDEEATNHYNSGTA